MTKQRETIVTVFGSANTSPGDELYKQAVRIGKLVASSSFVVCTGGYGGIMEAVSKGAKEAGGRTIGITIAVSGSKPNMYVDENVEMSNWVERLMELIAIGDIYIILQGGSGTLVELSAILEMMNKKVMKEKQIILFGSFWDKVIETLRIDSLNLSSLIDRTVKYAQTPEDLLSILKNL